MGSDVVRCALLVGLLVAVVAGVSPVWLLVLVAVGLGAAGTMFDNASQAIVPALVTRDTSTLQRAVARLYGAELVGTQFVGPAIGGVLFAFARTVPFAVDAVTFAISAILIFTIRGSFRPSRADDAPPPSLLREIRAGVVWLVRHRLLRTMNLLVGTINLAISAGSAVLVLLAQQRLHLGATGYGLLITAAALGGLSATLLAPRLSQRFGIATTLAVAVVCTAGGTAATGLAPNYWICAIGLILTSFSALLFNVAGAPLRQMLIPDDMLGRVISAGRVITWGAIPIGGILGGLIATHLGIRAPYIAGTGLLILAAIAAIRVLNTQAIDTAIASISISEQSSLPDPTTA